MLKLPFVMVFLLVELFVYCVNSICAQMPVRVLRTRVTDRCEFPDVSTGNWTLFSGREAYTLSHDAVFRAPGMKAIFPSCCKYVACTDQRGTLFLPEKQHWRHLNCPQGSTRFCKERLANTVALLTQAPCQSKVFPGILRLSGQCSGW